MKEEKHLIARFVITFAHENQTGSRCTWKIDIRILVGTNVDTFDAKSL